MDALENGASSPIPAVAGIDVRDAIDEGVEKRGSFVVDGKYCIFNAFVHKFVGSLDDAVAISKANGQILTILVVKV